MTEYHKIQTVYLRDPENKYKTLLNGQWAMPEFEYLANLQWEWTEKIDGTNIRIAMQNGVLRLDGKTDRAQIHGPLIAKLNELFLNNQALKDLGDCVLYGEGYGAGIQKGGNYIPDGCSFIVFDVKIGEFWLRRPDVYDVADKLGIRAVPVVGDGTLGEAVDFVREGFKSIAAKLESDAEGLVMRPPVDLYDRKGQRIIAKVKHKDFPR